MAPNIFESSVGAVGEHLGYIWNYKSNMAKLESQVNKLDDERADKSLAITLAENNAHRIREGVKSWQGKAHKISEEATQVLKDHQDKGKKRCLMGLCPNLVSCYRFSKRACKEQTEIEEAMTEAQRIRQVSYLSTEDCFTFDSRKSLLEDIIKALQDETNNLVGLYGLGGMGKTTLVKQVASHASKETMFDEVVMASVTQKVDVKEIQGQIASMLGLKLSESTIAERASRIHERLMGKKVLAVLDDLWKELDLKQVGIPFGAEHMGCKMILTTRFQPVLFSMGTKKEFHLGALKEDEAWTLFEEKTIDVIKNPAFNTVGKKVAKRCAGIPVLIVTVAASLSKRPQLAAWNDALKQLKKMNNKEMHDIVNSAIETISYNNLNETHKRLFVLCGVIGGEASVERVLQYCMGWDLFDDEAVTVQGARKRLHILILGLKDHCLLLDDNRRNAIQMPEFVRDIVNSIGEKDLSMLSIGDNDAQLNTWPTDDVLERCTSIVLRACPNLSCLPQQLECPELEMCILRDSSLTIPNTFFEKTGKLKVLDMSGLGFSMLPSSLSFLKNLQALRLDDCDNLKDISGVGELNKLQTLSFAGSNIEELPSGIGKLSELRLLDMRRCFQLKVIPAGLIEGLSRLEELYVSRYFVNWEADEFISGCVRNNASLVELKDLPDLCTLEIAVEDAKLLPEDLNFEKFERYEITVGEIWNYWSGWRWLDELEITKKICLQVGSTSINHLQQRVIKTTECLCLGEVKGIKNVSPELDENGFPELKHLCIKNDYEMQCIVNVEQGQHQVSFPSLESLRLHHLLKLQKICNGRLMKGSFHSLAILEVTKCNKLKSLFSFSVATKLQCLEELRVYACNVLEGIVGESKDYGGFYKKIEFGQLRKLSLERLSKLKNFTYYSQILRARHKSSIRDKESEEIHAEEEELQSCEPFFKKVLLPKLEELEIVECERLKFLLTPSDMVLVGLQILKVENCARMEHIVTKEERETNIDMISFPQLTHLHLENLPHFATFYGGSIKEKHSNGNLDTAMQPFFNENVSFPKLNKIYCANWNKSGSKVVECGKVYTMDFLSFPEKRDRQFEKVISGLEDLSIRSMDIMKILSLYDRFPSYLFQSLENLTITEFEGESAVIPLKFLSTVHNQLKTFRVVNCSFQEVFPYEGEVTSHADEGVFLPELRTLQLQNLPELNSICKQDQYSPFILNILDRIEYLDVLECPRLTRVLSTTRSLEHLKILRIIECEVIEEIIGEEGDCSEQESSLDDDEIIFSKLEHIELNKLPRLTTFCPSRDYTFNFPQLKIVTVTECPNMKTFSGGITTTPQLQKVYLEQRMEDSTMCWEHDLNRTVERIYTEMEAKRLATTLPSTSLSNHFGAQAQKHESFVEELVSEPRMEGQNGSNLRKESESRKDNENCVKLVKVVDDIRDKGKGKELQVSEETPLAEQVVAISQLDLASSSRSRSTAPTKSPSNQVSQVQVQRLPASISITSSNYHFKAPAQIHVDEPIKEGQINDQVAVEGGQEAKIYEKGIGKESEVSEETVELRIRNESETWNQSETSPCLATKGGTIIASSKLCEDETEPRKGTEIGEDEEAKRLGASLPPTSSSNHFEGEAQTHVNSARMESWDATNQEENVADICDKGKGKELGVSEDCDKYEKTPRYSDPSCSNCTGPEQTVAAYLASSQHVVASFSQLIPQNNNHPDEASPSLATQLEAERLATIPSISSTNHFEAQDQARDNQAEYRAEQTIEEHNAMKQKEEVVDTCEKAREQTFAACLASSQHVAASSSQLSPPIISHSDGVRASSLATQVEMVSATSSNNQFEAEAQFHNKSPKKSSDEPRKEGQICRNGIEELRREVGTSSYASNSQQKDFEELHVVGEHAMEWFGPYLEKSRECVERNKAISELKLEIAEMEVRMQVLKEKQKALEDENKARA